MSNKKLKFAYSTSTQLHEMLRGNFDMIETPIIMSYGNEIDIDIDFYLKIDGEASNEIENNIILHCELLDKPVFGIRRLKKSLQYNYLKKFGINTPKTYFQNSQMNEFNLINLLHDVEDNCELVIKIEAGARGIGQLLITKKDFLEIISKHDIYREKQKYEEFLTSKNIENEELENMGDSDYIHYKKLRKKFEMS